jgi:hypothetical protein
MSGVAMDDVHVHYNSDMPAQMNALAYTEGTDIHVAPGEERHLGHEAWHVVQQKQGRVKGSVQMKGKSLNEDPALEHEADVMGAKASSPSSGPNLMSSAPRPGGEMSGQGAQGSPVTQLLKVKNVGRKANVQESRLLGKIAQQNGDDVDTEVATKFTQNKFFSDVIETTTMPIRQYKITDDTAKFYSATSLETWQAIRNAGTGLDPAFGGKDDAHLGSVSDWNSRGYVYFSTKSNVAERYAKTSGYGGVDQNGNPKYALLEFTLEVNTPLTVDPEIPDGLRTPVLVPLNRIRRVN